MGHEVNLSIVNTEYPNKLIIVCAIDCVSNKSFRNSYEEEICIADIMLHIVIVHQVVLVVL